MPMAATQEQKRVKIPISAMVISALQRRGMLRGDADIFFHDLSQRAIEPQTAEEFVNAWNRNAKLLADCGLIEPHTLSYLNRNFGKITAIITGDSTFANLAEAHMKRASENGNGNGGKHRTVKLRS
jgi:hypothetical protein